MCCIFIAHVHNYLPCIYTNVNLLVALEIIKGRKIKRKELMTGKNKIN